MLDDTVHAYDIHFGLLDDEQEDSAWKSIPL